MKLHVKEEQQASPPGGSMVIGWQSGEAAALTPVSEGKTFNQKPSPLSTHYGFPNTGWACSDRSKNPISKAH
eukprot:scaffold48306_cov41-Cyclotella_meneghiniana.AAC.1